MITDNPKMKLFPELNKIYWDNKRSTKKLDLIFIRKYYTYVLLNGEYRIIRFGYTIFNKIKDLIAIGENYQQRIFKIRIKQTSIGMGGFDNYDDCFFSKPVENTVTEDFLKTKTMYIDDIFKNTYWTNDKQYSELIKFFKTNNIPLSKKIIMTKQRDLKLNRVLIGDGDL